MRKLSRSVLLLSLAVTSATLTAAQEVPKVLQITREFVKPGRAGMAHDHTESAFVEAMARAHWPTHYLGMTSLSGKSRSLYFTQYASFEAWQKDADAVDQNATLAGALDRAAMADGDLLDAMDQAVFYYRDEMSLHPHPDLSQFRYMSLYLYQVKPGKGKVWEEVVKLAKAGYDKGVPGAHWGMFELVYGGDAGTFLLLVGHKNLAEVDKGFTEDKQFAAAMGEDGMKHFEELYAECCEAAQIQLFAFNAHQSYVPDEWIKADPFWKPKAAAAAMPTKKATP